MHEFILTLMIFFMPGKPPLAMYIYDSYEHCQKHVATAVRVRPEWEGNLYCVRYREGEVI